jgi:hypothetical protein
LAAHTELFPPPALGERRHRRLAHRLVAVGRRAVFVVAEGEASLQIFLRRARWKGSYDVPAAGVGHRGAARREASDETAASGGGEACSAAITETTSAVSMTTHGHKRGHRETVARTRARPGGRPRGIRSVVRGGGRSRLSCVDGSQTDGHSIRACGRHKH